MIRSLILSFEQKREILSLRINDIMLTKSKKESILSKEKCNN